MPDGAGRIALHDLGVEENNVRETTISQDA